MSHRPLTSCFNIIFPCSFCSSIILFLYFLASLFTVNIRPPFLSSSSCLSLHLLNLSTPTQCLLSLSHCFLSISLCLSYCFSLSLFCLTHLFVCLAVSFSWDGGNARRPLSSYKRKWRKWCTHNSSKRTINDQI